MSGFPSVNFGQAERGLFSPEEIARLMASEYARSLRYGHELALLLIEIDRLESLHDLYGVESEARIVRAVASLVRSATRASDALGTVQDQRLLVLLPHTGAAGAAALARRLLAGCRELEFRGDGRILRATLSIGCAQRGDEGSLAALGARAEEALRAAVAAGGDRVLEHARLPRSVTPALPVPPTLAPPIPARPLGARVGAPLPDVREIPGATLEEKVRRLLRLAAGPGDHAALERDVLAVLERTLVAPRDTPAGKAEVRAEIVRLGERVAELRRLLDADEQELARLIEQKSLDPGVASIYRSVQGLDPLARNFAKKKELLAVLYRANVELLRQLEEEAGRG
jgi:diguanylate cyclase (GGDEF)-like protein